MKDNKKTRLKKQLLSTGIYIALAAAVVGVTTSTVAKIISGTQEKLPEIQNTKYTSPVADKIILPEIPAPDFSQPSQYTGPQSPVSNTQQGVNAEITQTDAPEQQASQASPTQSALDFADAEQDFGYPGYVKPCGGLITKEYTEDVLVYSPTMYDYRIHQGLDIGAEIGTPVKAVSGGVITDVAFDDMYGQTVTVESSDGLVLRYCNLSQALIQGIEVNAVVKTGDTIGGIGQTALCEAAEAPHLHLEASKNGSLFNPASLFDEISQSEAVSAQSSTDID